MALISAQPWNTAGKPVRKDLATRIAQPIANTAVNYGKLLGSAALATPLSIGSYLALKANQPKMAGNLAQGAINVRKAGGYTQPGVNDFTKGLGVTAKAVATTYGLANVPNMVRNAGKVIATPQVAKQVVQNVVKPQKVSEYVTKNGRDFFLKGRTPTYELNMPTKVFTR